MTDIAPPPQGQIRVLVTGGRDYRNSRRVFAELGALKPDWVIHGACRTGADEYANQWAIARGIPCIRYPADWDNIAVPGAVVRYRAGDRGRSRPYNAFAGHWRNQQMLDRSYPTHALVFPGGPGTADMRRRLAQAVRVGREIEIIDIFEGLDQ